MSHYQYLAQNSFLKLLAGLFFAAFILTACGGDDAAAPAAAPAPAGDTDDGIVTEAECVALDKYYNAGNNSCDDIVSSCDPAIFPIAIIENNRCVDGRNPFRVDYFANSTKNPLLDNALYTNTEEKCGVEAIGTNADQFGDPAVNTNSFETDEYYRSSTTPTDLTTTPMALICASTAYARIDNLINHETNGVKLNRYKSQQGGGGQIVAILGDSSDPSTDGSFYTGSREFTIYEDHDGDDDGINISPTPDIAISTKFTSIYDAKRSLADADRLYTDLADIIDENKGNCLTGKCYSTIAAGIIAAGKEDGFKSMHGVAYNAQLKGVVVDWTVEAQRILAIPQGVGADIVVMHNAWAHNATSCNKIAPTKIDGTVLTDTNYYFSRPAGQNFVDPADCTVAGVASDPLAAAELTAWKNAVDITGSNKTIIVFATGDQGFNSENGEVATYSNAALDMNQQTVTADSLLDDGVARNIPNFYAAYPALDFDDDDKEIATDRWLAVTGVVYNTTDKKLEIFKEANGCGIAMTYCLAAPHAKWAPASIASVDPLNYRYKNNVTNYASAGSTGTAAAQVSGALAVLKAAFPTMTPEQLAKLVLETATYIPLADETADAALIHDVTLTDGVTKRKINEVYGYGMLNLSKATTPDATAAISVNSVGGESIKLLWTDTSLTPSNHFGGGLDNVTFGIGDNYGRHFIASPVYNDYTPVTHNIDDYMAGFFGEHVQSNKLGAQARANYSNSEQSWMDLEYKAGKATTKIAFQENYKANPLTDMGATSILRANNIRPASNNIGMMDVDYQLGNNVSLSSYAARGEYDTGYRFDELGTDIDLRHKKSTLSLGIGHLREHEQFLGTNTTGAYELGEPSISQFTDVTYGRDLGKSGKFNIYANYINYKTDVDMSYQQFADIEGLQADQYQIGFKSKNILTKNDGLDVALITKLGVTDGALTQNTALGYTDAGALNNVTQSYDLSVQERHQQLEITYQGKLYQKSQGSVSLLKDNRFFSTVIIDRNLNHQQDVSQTEVIGGMRARF